MREPTPLPLNENAKDNFPPTYNGPKPHPFSQQTLSSIYWRVPELQSSLIFLIKDQQYQIAPHFLAEKKFHSWVLLNSSSVASVYLRIREKLKCVIANDKL